MDDQNPKKSSQTQAEDADEFNEKTAALKLDQETFNKELQKAKEHDACLILIRGTPQGHSFFLTQSPMYIGRDPTCEISIIDASISRKHAKIEKAGEKVFLTDLNSSNGTELNGTRLQPGKASELAKEDMVKIGNTILKFLPAGELEILFYGNLESAAYSDALTKIYNKRYLLEALEVEFKRAKALHSDFSVLFFDLDHFKKVNDTYGHDAGDYVLKEIAQVIRGKYIRPKDVFARYGGEEFVILLTNMNSKDASGVAERIRSSVEAHPFIYDQKKLPITVSMGVAELSTETESAQTLLKTADKALYSAKNSGRNRVVCAN